MPTICSHLVLIWGQIDMHNIPVSKSVTNLEFEYCDHERPKSTKRISCCFKLISVTTFSSAVNDAHDRLEYLVRRTVTTHSVFVTTRFMFYETIT